MSPRAGVRAHDAVPVRVLPAEHGMEAHRAARDRGLEVAIGGRGIERRTDAAVVPLGQDGVLDGPGAPLRAAEGRDERRAVAGEGVEEGLLVEAVLPGEAPVPAERAGVRPPAATVPPPAPAISAASPRIRRARPRPPAIPNCLPASLTIIYGGVAQSCKRNVTHPLDTPARCTRRHPCRR